MTKKKILYIHHGGAAGGAPLSLLQMLRALDDSVEPVICSARGDKQVLELFSREGFKTCSSRLRMFDHTTLKACSLKSWTDIQGFAEWVLDYRRACSQLTELLRLQKPDLVHFNSVTLTPYVCVPAQLGIPAIVHVREPVLNGIFGFRRRWLEGLLNRYATEVICICKDNLERLHLRPGLGKVIYNPVDFNQFDWHISQNNARAELGIAGEAHVACFAGGTNSVKGSSSFISAMNLVMQSIPHLKCIMPSFVRPVHFGRTPVRRLICRILYPAQERYAGSADMLYDADCVTAPEFRFDMQNCIAAADVMCVPHALPHFSRVVMEAGAMKRPVVAFRVGGIEEVVQDGVTGLLAEPGDVKGFAECVIKILKDRSFAASLGEAGYRQAVDLFDSHKSAQAITAVYRRILNGN